MHEKRNFIMVLLMVGSFIWGFWAWLFLPEDSTSTLWFQRLCATGLFASLGIWLIYGMNFQDKLENHLREVVGDMYYDTDGLSFLPIIRVKNKQAELCVYYQNRYENTAETVIHLRPPEDSFIIKPGARDVHFGFTAGGGDFGVIHQPIAVPQHIQGEVLSIQLAAASYYPRSHGARWRKETGMPCGTLNVDWGGNAQKVGVHEVSSEIELKSPVTLHLAMPKKVIDYTTGNEMWRQERIEAGIEG